MAKFYFFLYARLATSNIKYTERYIDMKFSRLLCEVCSTIVLNNISHIGIGYIQYLDILMYTFTYLICLIMTVESHQLT